jgi:hypothetical protein
VHPSFSFRNAFLPRTTCIFYHVRSGIGGGAFGVRGGISTRGVGVCVGPLSAGTSWRGGGAGGGGFLGWLIAAGILVLIVAWPYLLGTYIAVQCGAFNPSTQRFVVGWFFEVVYVAALVTWFVMSRVAKAQRSANAARQSVALQASGAVYEARSGKSVVYRHGTCTINHRSADTAAHCTKSGHESPAVNPTTDPLPDDLSELPRVHANRAAIRCGASILAVGIVAGVGILVADPIHSAAGDAIGKPCPIQLQSAAKSSGITMPDQIGQNAGNVEARLKELGVSSLALMSANPTYKSVWVASNWTVVSTDPAPGCVINASQSISVYVTK